MKKHLLFSLILLLIIKVNAQKTLLAGWTFDATAAKPNTPTSVAANLGIYASNAFIYADGTNGSSSWSQSNELDAFAGSTVNDPRSSTNAGNSYSLVSNNTANSKSIVIVLPTINYTNIRVSFDTRGSSTGFSTHQWAYSTDGSNFINFGTNTATTATLFSTKSLDLTSISAVNNVSKIYLRLTVNGASSAIGNNRLDNIQITSDDATWFGTKNTSYTTNSNWIPSNLNTSYSSAPNNAGSNAIVNSSSNNPVVNGMVSISNMIVLPQASLSVSSNNALTVTGMLTLQSDATGTASIGNSAGIISGNVTVQRYVGSNSNNPLYPWRMIGFPISGTVSASTLSGQYGSAYNTYTFAEGSDDQTNYGNTGTMNNGWQIFVTGTTPATNGILITGGTPFSTLNVTGSLNTGNQNIGLIKSKNGWNFIANPYASNITWSTIYSRNPSLVNSAVYRYNPFTTGYDSYVSGSSGTGGLTNGIIENGAGFFVQATATGNLQIQESDKTTSAPTASLMNVGAQHRSVGLDGTGNPSSSSASTVRLTLKQNGDTYGDEAVLLWGGGVPATDEFDSKYDAYDLGRMKGADLAVVDDKGITYSIFHGTELKSSAAENREVALKVSQLTEGSYTLDASIESPIANGNQLSIYDHYLNQYTLIDGSSKTYSFTVNSVPASQAANRFSLVMNAKPETSSSVPTISLLNNPTTNNSFTLYSQANFNTVQWQLIDGSGNNVGNGQLHSLQKGATYKVTTPVISNGLYFIKLTGDNKKLNTLKLIKN